MSAGLHHLEPVHVVHGLGRFGQGVVDRILDADARRTDQLDLLVDVVIRHDGRSFAQGVS
ncbi:hypothetical protein D3C75_1342720 [compost metagenome]